MVNPAKMVKSVKCAASPVSIELQSLVDTHDQPFVVIDAHYRIVAINSAYENTFGVTGGRALGQPCYRISHHNEVPCHEKGERCPHASLFSSGESRRCVHIHRDGQERVCQVRVTAYPLRASDGRLYMGELIEEISQPRDHRGNGSGMVGRCQPFLTCIDQLKTAAAIDAPVLVQGETGTGKELAAHFIHANSPRRTQPFLTVDCTVLTESLFEAEVFGHAKGAYTGSVGERVGLFEQADGGTLFLDEVGELPLSQQAKLLRVLESGRFRRVGGHRERSSNVRIVCATNRHLWDGVSTGRFREDLYYRIACMAVHLPPLRDRLDDIELLVPCLLEPISQTMKHSCRLTADAVRELQDYDYPGNVRELRNILFAAATRCMNSMIDVDLIRAVLKENTSNRHQHVADPKGLNARPAASRDRVASKDTLVDVEARHIAALLEQYQHSRKRVAAVLGVSERTLYRKLKRYALN